MELKMPSENRRAKKDALAAIRGSGRGVCRAFADYLETELLDAFGEMESAANEREIWRAQGKAQLARAIMNLLRKEG